MLIQIASVTQMEHTETCAIPTGKAIITLTLLQGTSALSISMLILPNHLPRLITLPTRYELQLEQINASLMSSLIARLQALEASGVGASTPELTHTQNTSISVLQRLGMKIKRFLTSHY